MEGHKDITEMSFEEFFNDPDRGNAAERAAEPAPVQRRRDDRARVDRGFGGVSPKINLKDGRFLLYIPRFTGEEGDQFMTAIDCDAGIIPSIRLESGRRQGGGRITRSASIDLTEAGVSPLDPFSLLIDGREVHSSRRRDLICFNNIGLPVGKPAGETYAVHRASRSLRLVKAEVLDVTERDGLVIEHLDVSFAGGVWLADVQPAPSPEDPPEAAPDAPTAEEPRKEAPRKAKRVRVKGSVTLPAGIREADVLHGGETLPVFREPPEATLSVEGCDPSECTVSVTDSDGEMVFGRVPAENGAMTLRCAGSDGRMTVVLERDGKELARSAFFLIPDFACDCSGKGDIPDDPEVTFTMFGETRTMSIYDDAILGPYTHRGAGFTLMLNVPAVTYDLGDGPVPFSPADIDVEDLRADVLKVTVRGARKRKLFFGGEKGKKRDVSPDWDTDTITVDLAPVKDEVYSVPAGVFCFYIAVNSMPNRRLITIRNPVRLTAVHRDGVIAVDAGDTALETVCRVYNMDKSVDETVLGPGESEVPVGPGAVEAEVVQTRDGKVCVSVPVRIRDLPFLATDPTGDRWLHVSRDKRIPLPDGLIRDGVPDLAAVRSWHDRIVRMNPELRDVTYAMMQRAFEAVGKDAQ